MCQAQVSCSLNIAQTSTNLHVTFCYLQSIHLHSNLYFVHFSDRTGTCTHTCCLQRLLIHYAPAMEPLWHRAFAFSIRWVTAQLNLLGQTHRELKRTALAVEASGKHLIQTFDYCHKSGPLCSLFWPSTTHSDRMTWCDHHIIQKKHSSFWCYLPFIVHRKTKIFFFKNSDFIFNGITGKRHIVESKDIV